MTHGASQGRIDKAIKVSVVAEGKITLIENDSIKAAEAEVRRHGVLLLGCPEITSIA